MSIDYLSSNAINKYPFADNMSLTSVSDVVLPNDVFLDVIIVAKKNYVNGAYLSSYSSDGSSGLELRITTFDKEESNPTTFAFSVPYAQVLEKETYTTSNNDIVVKIVFGAGAVRDKDLTTNLEFTINTARFAPSAVIQLVPRVSSISFINWNKDSNTEEGTPIAIITGSELVSTDLMISEGSNVNLLNLSNGVNIDIFPGGGTGLYDGCAINELTIKTINGVGPDQYNSFLLATDDCYTTTPFDNGLLIENHCTPKCSTDQLGAFAHYVNRVTDGLQDVGDYGSSIAGALKATVDAFTATLGSRNLPYMRVKYGKYATLDSGYYFLSFVVGFFNPYSEEVTVDVDITVDGVLRSVNYRMDDETSLVEFGSTTFNLTAAIPCIKRGILEFVFRGQVGDTVTIVGNIAASSAPTVPLTTINYSADIQ